MGKAAARPGAGGPGFVVDLRRPSFCASGLLVLLSLTSGCALLDALGDQGAATGQVDAAATGVTDAGDLDAAGGNGIFGPPVSSNIGRPLTGLAIARSTPSNGPVLISLDRINGDFYVMLPTPEPGAHLGYQSMQRQVPGAVAFAVADIDGDGLDDLIAASATGAVVLFLQQTDGYAFTDGVTINTGLVGSPSSVAALKIDDGPMAIVVGGDGVVAVLRSDGTASGYALDSEIPLGVDDAVVGVVGADFDADGIMDLVAGTSQDSFAIRGASSAPWQPGPISGAGSCSDGGPLFVVPLPSPSPPAIARAGAVGVCMLFPSSEGQGPGGTIFRESYVTIGSGGAGAVGVDDESPLVLIAHRTRAEVTLAAPPGPEWDPEGSEFQPLLPSEAAALLASGLVLYDADQDGKTDLAIAVESSDGILVLPRL